MMDFFRHRLYPESVLKSAPQRVTPISRSDALHPTPKSASSDRTILVLPHHPHNFAAIRILNRHLPILHSDPSLQILFPDPPMIAFKRDRNLRDMLVRSRLRDQGKGHRGTTRCNRSVCKTCPYVFETPSITFPKEEFEVREGFSCVSRNLIYAIVCSRCGMTYVGETGRRLADRFREHLRSIEKRDAIPVAAHFNLGDHRGIHDIQVTGIISCSSSDRNRLSLENRLIVRLGTLAPLGINVSLSLV
jgi:hypothetical protein